MAIVVHDSEGAAAAGHPLQLLQLQPHPALALRPRATPAANHQGLGGGPRAGGQDRAGERRRVALKDGPVDLRRGARRRRTPAAQALRREPLGGARQGDDAVALRDGVGEAPTGVVLVAGVGEAVRLLGARREDVDQVAPDAVEAGVPEDGPRPEAEAVDNHLRALLTCQRRDAGDILQLGLPQRDAGEGAHGPGEPVEIPPHVHDGCEVGEAVGEEALPPEALRRRALAEVRHAAAPGLERAVLLEGAVPRPEQVEAPAEAHARRAAPRGVHGCQEAMEGLSTHRFALSCGST
mmetsp:Transcript_100587/g.313546  ORF Transcript_100587/g.313546 Transcript_100587/m.313546 type:complete len:294 (-) Transcript_100587:36-917(-)